MVLVAELRWLSIRDPFSKPNSRCCVLWIEAAAFLLKVATASDLSYFNEEVIEVACCFMVERAEHTECDEPQVRISRKCGATATFYFVGRRRWMRDGKRHGVVY